MKWKNGAPISRTAGEAVKLTQERVAVLAAVVARNERETAIMDDPDKVALSAVRALFSLADLRALCDYALAAMEVERMYDEGVGKPEFELAMARLRAARGVK